MKSFIKKFIGMWLLALPLVSYAQSYRMDYDIEFGNNSDSNCGTSALVQVSVVGPFGTLVLSEGSGQMPLSSRPTRVDFILVVSFDVDGNCMETNATVPLDFASDICTSLSNGGTTGDFTVSIEPELSFNTSSSSPVTTTTPYCQDDNITLVATSGFSSYRWQYNIDGGGFVNFTPPGSGNARTFGLSNLVGSNISSILGRNITFRHSVGNCNINSVNGVIGPYVFNPLPASINPPITTPETCFGDGTASIQITGVNRPAVPNEVFTYELRTSSGAFKGSTTGTVFTDANVIGNLTPDNYQILTFGELSTTGAATGCGNAPSPVSFPLDGPDDAITNANAGSDETVCETTANLSGNNVDSTDETGIWTRISGSGTISNPNSRNTTISNLGTGNNVFRWTITQDPAPVCTDFDDVTITRIAVTNANAGSNQNVCGNSATLGGNSPAGGENGTWTLVSGSGSFADASLRNTTVSGLAEGDNVFQWTIRDDGDNCFTEDQVTINFTQLTTPDAGTDQFACNTDAVLNANGVASGETGTWTVVAGSGTFDNANNAVTTVSGLTIGTNTFRWTIADNGNNCPSQNDQVTIELSDLSVAEVGASRTDPSCFGDSDGSITFVGNGGVGIPTGLDYEFTLSNGEQMFANTGQQVTFSGLTAGAYSVTIEDDQCVRSSQTVVLSNPTAITVVETISDFNGRPISCNGENDGQIILNVSGGNGGFTYSWSNGETTRDLNNLTAGTYTVTVTDVNSCIDIQTYVLEEPFVLNGSTIPADVACNGEANGSIDLDVSGGTAPYTYNWSNGETTQDINTLPQGNYSVTITDANNCSVEVNNISIVEPTPVSLAVDDQIEVACNGEASGEVTLLGTGGTGDKEYSQDGTNFQSNPIFGALPAGNYTFFVRDVNGCDNQVSTNITEPTLLTSSVTNLVNTTCGEANGAALANATGGTGAYAFDWRDDAGQQVSNQAQLSNVNGGVYTVTITDDNGCTTMNTAVISSTDGAIVSTNNIVPTSCFDTNDGQATLNIVGDPPFVINWENGETGFTAVALTPGDNNVTITDNNNCTTVEVVNIPAPQPIIATIQNSIIPTCDDSTDGAITLDIAGGTGSYTFLWNTGATTSMLAGIPAGDYSVTITDTNNCTLTAGFSLVGVEPLSIEVINTISPTCNGDTDGLIEIQASGGNGGYTYLWNNNITTPTQNNVAAGDYQVTITDSRGCNETFTVNLPDTAPLELDLGGDKIVCTGSVLTIAAPIDNATYAWTSSNGFTSTQQQVTLENEGNYTLQVTNSDGCIATDSFNLTASDDLLQADFLMVSEAYTGDTIVIIDISWPIPETITWNYGTSETTILTQNNDFSEVIFNVPGIYNVNIETNLGDCFDIKGQDINILDRADKPGSGGRIAADNKPLIENFKIYPNPNDGRFEIEVELSQIADIDLQLIDLQGNQSILNLQDTDKDSYNIPVNIPQIQPGIYLLSLNANKENKVLRVVVR